LRVARGGRWPGVDGAHIAVLGGSYSALHVLRLLERRSGERVFDAAVLMGPPVDLFDMRRRLEDRTFVPPFGLDRALVALGLPDRAPLRYWRHSGIYHVHPDYPPVLLVHSRDDPVVPFQQSEQLAAALEGAGVPYELHVFEGAGHYLLSPGGEAQAIYDLTMRFLDERLKP
jgi:dipeptidyl aminopeptidase/acylaminoacyl peptidase